MIAKQCMACHNFAKGGPNMVGPNLWGVLGGPHAHKKDYSYSDAMKNFKGTWDYESVNKFIHKPQEFVPGTKMGFAGLKKVQDRADVIAWLRLQSDNPIPLPPAGAAQTPAAGTAPATGAAAAPEAKPEAK
jgi:cytochrome c